MKTINESQYNKFLATITLMGFQFKPDSIHRSRKDMNYPKYYDNKDLNLRIRIVEYKKQIHLSLLTIDDLFDTIIPITQYYKDTYPRKFMRETIKAMNNAKGENYKL